MMHPKDAQVVVVGAGKVGTRRIEQLLDYHSDIVVISPELPESLLRKVRWEKRRVRDSECFLASILVLCTNVPKLHDELMRNRAPRQLIYRAEEMAQSDFHFPTSIQRGNLTITLSTHGSSPHYAKRLEREIREMLPRAVEEELAFLEEARTELKQQTMSQTMRSELLKRISAQSFLNDPNRKEAFELLAKQWSDEF
ncbi:NAD(P)-dependent oxidoreductase [Geomicrobium sediminis]|uniref:precorrin-2 dehydrogenase n=1 Tax=Geomicrobium sediminis TaxID=1347788 RepID=A0ABS2PA91_9BACL|nr:NAD(P)-dependent oxidoreductase [Geomicrobium sediminis]MBM7632319.1 precorrin-2 dehydrogenase/sirohydrochlorin ferrochelatase [Geomicrobium sediminis]